jgi:excisionase family DNA binding protein
MSPELAPKSVDRPSSDLPAASNSAKLDLLPLAPLSLRARDAARLLGLSERALWSLTNRGEIPCVRIGRAILYPVDSVREWLAQRARASVRKPKAKDEPPA